MDLTSAFGMAFWEIHSGSGQRRALGALGSQNGPRPALASRRGAQWSEVEAVLNSKCAWQRHSELVLELLCAHDVRYEQLMDLCLLEKVGQPSVSLECSVHSLRPCGTPQVV